MNDEFSIVEDSIAADELAKADVEGMTPVPVPTLHFCCSQLSYCAVSFTAHEVVMQL